MEVLIAQCIVAVLLLVAFWPLVEYICLLTAAVTTGDGHALARLAQIPPTQDRDHPSSW